MSASPTKRFFMNMLTRDIALMDAIMDLLDNCIDGVHRQNKLKGDNGQSLYSGYFGHITIDDGQFTLTDNCGGISLDTAINYAFKMGRSDDYHDDDNLKTVGMYGIGMKRAIFKMGLEAEVMSNHKKDAFKVTIPNDWADDPEWEFDYTALSREQVERYLNEEGAFIKISNLHPNISRQFKDSAGFVRNLKLELKNHYGYIVQQGFEIKLNGTKIDPLVLEILTSTDSEHSENSIKPYVYKSNHDGVEVEAIVGFYRPPATDDEIEDGLEGFAKSQSENAGITVVCNDRIVLYCDKTFLTGWGEPPVPNYHTQFINIAGVVHFRSSDPIKLPVTTTKRGLDTSSAVYAEVKKKVKDGIKIFTSFTNNWKKPTEERTKLFKSLDRINALLPGSTNSEMVTLTHKKKNDDSLYQIPVLPRPDDEVRRKSVNISFSREKEKVESINQYFLDGEKTSAADIGGWCFDQLYSQVE